MTQPAPTPLLRLRESDVVRLCGLAAVARGMEYERDAAVTHGTRKGARLAAEVAGEPEAQVWVEAPGDIEPGAVTWGCTLHPHQSAADLACEHVAALLTAWIRHPDDFRDLAPPPPDDNPARSDVGPSPRERVEQPSLLEPSRTRRSPGATTLAGELARLSSADVREVARRVLGAVPEATDTQRQALLVRALTDPGRLRALVERLDERVRALLAAALFAGGSLTVNDLDAYAERSGQPASAVQTQAGILERHALLFRVAGAGVADGTRGERGRTLSGWRIPPDVRQALPWLVPLRPSPNSPSTDGAPNAPPAPDALPAALAEMRVDRATPRELARALALLARAPAPLGPYAERRPERPERAPTNARGRVLVPGDLAPERLVELARAAGLAPGITRLARRVLLLAREDAPGQPLTDLATVHSQERPLALRAGFLLWRDAQAPFELKDLDASNAPVRVRLALDHAAFSPAALASEVAEARSFLVRLVGRLPSGTWYAVDDLLDLLWRMRPGFLRGKQRTFEFPYWTFEDAQTGRALRSSEESEWRLGEGTFVRHVLAGPLAWWGMVEVARRADGTLAAFRRTPFGQYLVCQSEQEMRVPAETEAALAGGDRTPVLPARDGMLAVDVLASDGPLLAELDRWARVAALANGRLLYAPSAERAASALDDGARPETLLALLRTLAPRAAETIAPRLTVWQAAYGRSRLHVGMVLLDAADEATLREALAYVPEIAARCRILGPAVALVPADDLDRLTATLSRRGYHV